MLFFRGGQIDKRRMRKRPYKLNLAVRNPMQILQTVKNVFRHPCRLFAMELRKRFFGIASGKEIPTGDELALHRRKSRLKLPKLCV